jgi:hypothetical protein
VLRNEIEDWGRRKKEEKDLPARETFYTTGKKVVG